MNITQCGNLPFEIMTFDNLYTVDEIKEHVKFIEMANNKEQRFTNNKFKNGKIINEELSNLIFSRLENILPKMYIDRNMKKWKIVNSSKYIFYAKYENNEFFNIHTDTGSIYDPVNNLYSKFTLLTYLNDDYVGGETIFYDEILKETSKIVPKTNKTLIFDIDIFHKGNNVTKNNKYWIGTEIVCEFIHE